MFMKPHRALRSLWRAYTLGWNGCLLSCSPNTLAWTHWASQNGFSSRVPNFFNLSLVFGCKLLPSNDPPREWFNDRHSALRGLRDTKCSIAHHSVMPVVKPTEYDFCFEQCSLCRTISHFPSLSTVPAQVLQSMDVHILVIDQIIACEAIFWGKHWLVATCHIGMHGIIEDHIFFSRAQLFPLGSHRDRELRIRGAMQWLVNHAVRL